MLVEQSATATQQLEAHLRTLHCDDATIVHQSTEQFLQCGPGDTRYDVVFLDPPFGKQLMTICTKLLEEKNWLAPGARIYLENERDLPASDIIPTHWCVDREKTAGQITYRLATRPM